MSQSFVSRFTPSLMAPQALEAIFVQREQMAERLVDLTRESALSGSKHHTLLVGARGIGKTHLVSVIYHRVRQLGLESEHRLVISWLREEEWGVTSFLDLLIRILRALVEEYGDSTLRERVETLYDLPPELAERSAAKMLKEYVGERTLFLIVENLNDLFEGFGEEGQQRLRSYIQENPFFTILATSQRLFKGVSLQTSPFYGFFRVLHLEELGLEEATELLVKIAELEGDEQLASFIKTSTGRARIRALQHLAGGNHRVHIIFSQFLTRESLDEFIDALMRTLDELTPYYHERIRWLSPQQRKIVELLCDLGNALSVKEIASRCFMTPQTASGQLKTLRDLGYVKTTPLGRESYYELNEPLMRLCIEVKKHHDRPIRLVVELLRSWYSTEELEQRLSRLPVSKGDKRSEREHVLAALNRYEAADVILAVNNQDEFASSLRAGAQGDTHLSVQAALAMREGAQEMAERIVWRYRLDSRGDMQSAEDLAQTALLHFFKQAANGKFKDWETDEYRGYLYGILKHEALHLLRDKRRSLEVQIDEEFEEVLRREVWDERAPDAEMQLDFRFELIFRVQYHLLEALDNSKKLRHRLSTLYKRMKESGVEDVLSESLLRSVSLFLNGPKSGVDLLCKLHNAAKKELGEHEDFQLVLRLLAASIRYAETDDERVLLELRSEERKLLESVLDSHSAVRYRIQFMEFFGISSIRFGDD